MSEEKGARDEKGGRREEEKGARRRRKERGGKTFSNLYLPYLFLIKKKMKKKEC